MCNRYETYLYNSLESGREAIKAIGADNVQLHGDTYHMNIEEKGYYQCLVDCADVLGLHAHERKPSWLGGQWHDQLG